MIRLAVLVLVCLTIALGGVVAIECMSDTVRGRVPLPAGAIRALPASAHAGDTRQVQAWVDAILARPLFEPSRRAPATVTGSGTSGPGFPRLTGIIILPQRREAIFAVPGKAQPLVVAEGSRLNGVLIKTIEAGEVVIVDATGIRVIRPAFAPTTSQSGAPPTPVMIDLPPVPSSREHASPFASIRGLSGRPMGLAVRPDQTPPVGGSNNTAPSLPAPAGPGGSP